MENLIIFSDDWGRHPSSCQHLTKRLPVDANVLWVNTIGTRPPRLDLYTACRAYQKFSSWFVGRDHSAHPARTTGMKVLAPYMWPWTSGIKAQNLNRKLLIRQLVPQMNRIEGDWIGLTTVPISGLVIDHLPVSRWIYYCVDDFSVWPGLDAKLLIELEQQIVPKVDEIVCASDVLCKKITEMGRHSKIMTHGVDSDFWKDSRRVETKELNLSKDERPLIVFWGVVDRRLDSNWIKALSDSMTSGTILLLGPQQNPDVGLARLHNVETRGTVSIDALPRFAAAADVLIMPYVDEPVTRSMQPLKLKEYLATGRPAVVRKLPSTVEWSDCCDVVETAQQFADVTLRRCGESLSGSQRRARKRLELESWEAKASEFWQIVFSSPSRAA